ncbi:IS630 family transposase domain protein [Candidatus Cyrtobacter comes]|uniref:IS630 family transposase domain protein n=1 Tax=Candidatus Cyrtobacter comes TaxID=675776 RepID=A0ABU5L9H1_9RICK|nr:IS630 family transposase domain protein [Candidatus Cyrtobacter comes]
MIFNVELVISLLLACYWVVMIKKLEQVEASFHRSKRELIESMKCSTIFPYSPDLNSIEKFWANMK